MQTSAFGQIDAHKIDLAAKCHAKGVLIAAYTRLVHRYNRFPESLRPNFQFYRQAFDCTAVSMKQRVKPWIRRQAKLLLSLSLLFFPQPLRLPSWLVSGRVSSSP